MRYDIVAATGGVAPSAIGGLAARVAELAGESRAVRTGVASAALAPGGQGARAAELVAPIATPAHPLLLVAAPAVEQDVCVHARRDPATGLDGQGA